MLQFASPQMPAQHHSSVSCTHVLTGDDILKLVDPAADLQALPDRSRPGDRQHIERQTSQHYCLNKLYIETQPYPQIPVFRDAPRCPSPCFESDLRPLQRLSRKLFALLEPDPVSTFSSICLYRVVQNLRPKNHAVRHSEEERLAMLVALTHELP